MKRRKKSYPEQRKKEVSLTEQAKEAAGTFFQNICSITASGQRELVIENHKSIVEYHSGKLVLLTGQCKVEISGKNLEIVYYGREEMKVRGTIESITYKK